jgi:multiple sugar transport system permease protein
MRRRREQAVAYGFLLPYLVVFVLFRFGPVVAGFLTSFTRWGIVGSPKYIGFSNYEHLLHDPIFATSLKNTLYFVLLSTPSLVLLGLVLALLVNQPLKGRVIARTALFTPYVVMSAVVGVMWLWLYNTHYGLINYYLMQLGLPAIPWLSSPAAAMPALAIAQVWWIAGFNMIILLAGLQDIPAELQDAARIDGASEGQVFRRVTLPLLTPTIFIVTMLTLINTVQVFDLIFVTTQGGPSLSTVSLVYYLYVEAFQNFNLGYGSAIAYVAFAVLVVFGILQTVVQRRVAH